MNNQIIGNIILEASQDVPEVTIIAEKHGKVEGTGLIQTLGDENRNGRIYELKDMKPEVEGDRIQKELIPTGNMCGHDGHPASTELSIQSVIDPKLTSVRYTKIWIEGNEIHANFKGTNNDYGKAFNADLMEGVRPSFSLRALGSVDRERNGKCYVRNIRIITWDRVIFPSHKRAYMSNLITTKNESAVMESCGYNLKEYELTNSTKAFKEGVLIPVINQQVVDYIKHESANVKSIINTFETLYESAVICGNGKQVQLNLANGGGKILVNLEQYIQDEIMNYCWNGGYDTLNEFKNLAAKFREEEEAKKKAAAKKTTTKKTTSKPKPKEEPKPAPESKATPKPKSAPKPKEESKPKTTSKPKPAPKTVKPEANTQPNSDYNNITPEPKQAPSSNPAPAQKPSPAPAQNPAPKPEANTQSNSDYNNITPEPTQNSSPAPEPTPEPKKETNPAPAQNPAPKPEANTQSSGDYNNITPEPKKETKPNETPPTQPENQVQSDNNTSSNTEEEPAKQDEQQQANNDGEITINKEFLENAKNVINSVQILPSRDKGKLIEGIDLIISENDDDQEDVAVKFNNLIEKHLVGSFTKVNINNRKYIHDALLKIGYRSLDIKSGDKFDYTHFATNIAQPAEDEDKNKIGTIMTVDIQPYVLKYNNGGEIEELEIQGSCVYYAKDKPRNESYNYYNDLF